MFNIRGTLITAETKKVEESNIKKLIPTGHIVVDGFDNSASRKLITDHCLKNHIDCLHVGLATGYAEVVWNEVYRVPGDGGVDVCEYPLSRNITLLATTVAAEALIQYLATGNKNSYDITLGDLNITRRKG